MLTLSTCIYARWEAASGHVQCLRYCNLRSPTCRPVIHCLSTTHLLAEESSVCAEDATQTHGRPPLCMLTDGLQADNKPEEDQLICSAQKGSQGGVHVRQPSRSENRDDMASAKHPAGKPVT